MKIYYPLCGNAAMKNAPLCVCIALLIATPANAGDYILYDCKPTKVLLSIPAKGEIGFSEYTFDRSGALKGGRELPSNLFRIEDGGRRLYYRGKLCIELDQWTVFFGSSLHR